VEAQAEARIRQRCQIQLTNSRSRTRRRHNRIVKLKSLSTEEKLRNPEWTKYLRNRAKKAKKEKKRAQLKVAEYRNKLGLTLGGRGATLEQRVEYLLQINKWKERARNNEARKYGATEGAWATFHRPVHYLAPPPYHRKNLFKYNNPYS